MVYGAHCSSVGEYRCRYNQIEDLIRDGTTEYYEYPLDEWMQENKYDCYAPIEISELVYNFDERGEKYSSGYVDMISNDGNIYDEDYLFLKFQDIHSLYKFGIHLVWYKKIYIDEDDALNGYIMKNIMTWLNK